MDRNAMVWIIVAVVAIVVIALVAFAYATRVVALKPNDCAARSGSEASISSGGKPSPMKPRQGPKLRGLKPRRRPPRPPAYRTRRAPIAKPPAPPARNWTRGGNGWTSWIPREVPANPYPAGLTRSARTGRQPTSATRTTVSIVKFPKREPAAAVLFDIDGVNSNYLHVHPWYRAFTDVGCPCATHSAVHPDRHGRRQPRRDPHRGCR